MNIQELEERDYNPLSEDQNAFAQSKAEMDHGDDIDALTKQGWHVFVIEIPQYCRSTDAYIGIKKRAHYKSKIRQEVEAVYQTTVHLQDFDPDFHAYVAPR